MTILDNVRDALDRVAELGPFPTRIRCQPDLFALLRAGARPQLGYTPGGPSSFGMLPIFADDEVPPGVFRVDYSDDTSRDIPAVSGPEDR